MPAISKVQTLLKQYAHADKMYHKNPKTGEKVPIPKRASLLMQAACQVFPTLPHYLIDVDLINTLNASNPRPQLKALREFQAARLPFRELVVEFPVELTGEQYFLYMGDDDDGTIDFIAARLGKDNYVCAPVHARTDPYDPDAPEQLVNFHYLEDPAESQQLADEFFAVYAAMVLMPHIKGVEREVHPAPERLNKQRKAKGKPPIREFTRLYIGRVEDANGKSHAYTGRTMPVHMRAGHTRNQRYGKGRELVKTVYIAPVLVNFKQGDEVPVPRRVVKMVA
jgi:hypothetical protein